ncbi:MAG: DUF192 domain-containing protein [Chloroflexi bacterium]|nr:MAG: DUF192 domain-containing protein [Chloroflexota bacterium]
MTRIASVLAIIAAAILVACNSNTPAAAIPTASAPPAETSSATPGATATTPGAATAITTVVTGPTGTSVPVATPTAAPTPIPTPHITPTPAIKGEPIASTSSLSKSELPLVRFTRRDALVASLPIEVLPPDEFPVGFSGRPSIGDERGMLFWYQKMARGSFWMKNTHFDLAIAFVASDETIVDIVEMHRESTSIVTPKADYQYAIEAPAGWYLGHGIALGDHAHLAFPLPSYLTNQ